MRMNSFTFLMCVYVRGGKGGNITAEPEDSDVHKSVIKKKDRWLLFGFILIWKVIEDMNKRIQL